MTKQMYGIMLRQRLAARMCPKTMLATPSRQIHFVHGNGGKKRQPPPPPPKSSSTRSETDNNLFANLRHRWLWPLLNTRVSARGSFYLVLAFNAVLILCDILWKERKRAKKRVHKEQTQSRTESQDQSANLGPVS